MGEDGQVEYVLQVEDKIPAQVRFWRSEDKVRVFLGGIGSGKSFAGVVEVWRQPAGSIGMVVAPTYPQLRDSAQALFLEITPKGMIRSHNKNENKTVLTNGTTILWRSADRPDSLRGPNLGWVWGDEWAYATEKAHKVVVGRLRRHPARMWITTTPNGENWLYDWCEVKPLGYEVFRGKTEDNIYNAPGYFESLVQQYEDDPDFAAQELRGEWVDLGKARYYSPQIVDACFEPCDQFGCHELPKITGQMMPDGTKPTYELPYKDLRLYALPVQGRDYVIGGDCAHGVRGGDDATWVVLGKLTGETCAVLAGEYEPVEEHAAYGAMLSRFFGGAPALPERNDVGKDVVAALERFGVKVLPGLDGNPGWHTGPGSKARMASISKKVLKAAAGSENKILPDLRLVKQIKSIGRQSLHAPGKKKGKKKIDDEWIGWAIGHVARLIEDGWEDWDW